MECVTTSTWVAPVAARSASTRAEISWAVVALDWLLLYVQALSCASVQPSALKRETMVLQVEALPFQPCTNRMGWRVGAGARAAAGPKGFAPGSQAARARTARTSGARSCLRKRTIGTSKRGGDAFRWGQGRASATGGRLATGTQVAAERLFAAARAVNR
jgi:hypothetical protein